MPALALLLLGKARAILSTIVDALGKLNIWQLGCIALALFAGVQTLRLHAEQRHSAKVEAQLAKSDAARHADRLAYEQAQRDAQAANRAQVQKVEQQYQRNSDNEREAYLSDRAKLIAYYDGLRAQRKAAPGASGATGSPENSAPAAGADGHAMPVPSGDDLQTKQDAADIELRLLHLQQYVEGLLTIDPNK